MLWFRSPWNDSLLSTCIASTYESPIEIICIALGSGYSNLSKLISLN